MRRSTTASQAELVSLHGLLWTPMARSGGASRTSIPAPPSGYVQSEPGWTGGFPFKKRESTRERQALPQLNC